MTVKELMDYLKECPENATITVRPYNCSATYKPVYDIKEMAGFFNVVKDVVKIYIE